VRGVRGDTWEKACHLVLKLKLDPTNEKMGEETIVVSLIGKQ
jgi:hypothetical protein